MSGEAGLAIVTGGTSGIGRETALVFGSAGFGVAVLGRDPLAGREVVEAIAASGGRAAFLACDITRGEAVDRAVTAAVETFGPPACAVNAAGVEADGRPLVEGSEELFGRIVDTNLKGVWLAMRAELRAMKGQGGAIVNIASVGGLVGFPQASIYCAAKHGVIGLTKSAALEHAAEGIRVNAVAPGTVDTPMLRRFAGEDPDLRRAIERMHPLGRLAGAGEIAAAALWLCSPQAAFVTGETLAVDGGFTAR